MIQMLIHKYDHINTYGDMFDSIDNMQSWYVKHANSSYLPCDIILYHLWRYMVVCKYNTMGGGMYGIIYDCPHSFFPKFENCEEA